MSNNIPVTSQEYERLLNLIKEKAREFGRRDFIIYHEEISAVIENDNDQSNRIRWTELGDKLREDSILWSYDNPGYSFVVPTRMVPRKTVKKDIAMKKEKSNPVPKQPVQTFTTFGHDYIMAPEFIDLRNAIKAKMREELGTIPYVWGPFGCGKDHAIEYALSLEGIQCIREPLTIYKNMNTAISRLIGSYAVIERNGVPVTTFKPGIIPQCAMSGQAFIGDEIDRMDRTVAMIFQYITERGSHLVVQTDRGYETVDIVPGFMMIFTANTEGFGDNDGFYPGAQVLDRSLRSRFGPYIKMDYHIDIEAELCREYLPPAVHSFLFTEGTAGDPTSEGLVRKIRKSLKNKDFNDLLATRSILEFAKNYHLYGWHKGMIFFFLSGMNPDNREFVTAKIRDKMGSQFVPTTNESEIKTLQNALRDKGFLPGQ